MLFMYVSKVKCKRLTGTTALAMQKITTDMFATIHYFIYVHIWGKMQKAIDGEWME